MNIFDAKDRESLKQLLTPANPYSHLKQENTEILRQEKNSTRLMRDARVMEQLLKNTNATPQFIASQCSFMAQNYKDIFRKMMENECSFAALYELLGALKAVEDGEIDQEQASIAMGKFLFSSARKQELTRGGEDKEDKVSLENTGSNLTYRQFRAKQLRNAKSPKGNQDAF